jgi:hypothetical protein
MKRSFLVVLLICGCGPGDGVGRGTASNGGNGGTNGGNGEDMSLFGRDLSVDPRDLTFINPDACAAVSAMATLTKRPVDIIVTIDDSGSMSQELDAVEKNINVNFANILGMSGLDYRVIMFTQFGTGTYQICVKPPLGGNACAGETKPVNTANFFHYSLDVESYDSLKLLIQKYNVADANGLAPNGWSQWLRPDALKVFIEVTDDESTDMTSTDFDTMLLAKTPKMFGDATKRDYVFYSITGVVENNPATKAYAPTDALVTGKCSTAVNAGQEYQKLSRLTGGLRFPICQLASFDVVFQAVAAGVVAGARVACSFEVPTPTTGENVDINSVQVKYTPSAGGMQKVFTKVDDISQCTTAGNFYITTDSDLGTPQIVLCPDACTTVQGDSQAQIGVTFDCSVS